MTRIRIDCAVCDNDTEESIDTPYVVGNWEGEPFASLPRALIVECVIVRGRRPIPNELRADVGSSDARGRRPRKALAGRLLPSPGRAQRTSSGTTFSGAHRTVTMREIAERIGAKPSSVRGVVLWMHKRGRVLEQHLEDGDIRSPRAGDTVLKVFRWRR